MDARLTPVPVLVAGAGSVGLSCALALAHFGLRVRVLDAGGETRQFDDPRAIALSHGSRLILERLGAWDGIAATPIRHIEVSQQGGFGRTRIEASDHGLDALGHVVRLGAFTAHLLARARAAGVDVRHDCAVGQAEEGEVLRVTTATGIEETALLVRAEGSPPADRADVKDYAQCALVAEVEAAGTHDHRAYERFTPEGPLALLPLERGYSLVWCASPANARRRLAQDDTAFLTELAQATRFAQLAWRAAGPRAAYPLALRRAHAEDGGRVVALGNAAQALHPVAGQGFNLGLRDAFELAAHLADGIDADALAAYRRARKRDRDATIGLTDAYVTVFSNEVAPLRLARGLGLAMLDLIPPARALVARRMMFGMR